MKHRHNGPMVKYRTSRGRIMHRKRPAHNLTIKKQSGRRVSRGKSFEGRESLADSKDEFSSVEWNYLISKFGLSPENVDINSARDEIEEYRKSKEMDEELFTELTNSENEYQDAVNNMQNATDNLEQYKQKLIESYRQYMENKIKMYPDWKHTSSSKEIQEIYNSL